MLRTDWLIRRDWPDVLRIARASFGRRKLWTEPGLEELMGRRETMAIAASQEADPLATRKLLGFVIFSVLDLSIRIDHLAVDGDCRRRGVGRCLVDQVQSRAELIGRRRVWSDVDERNLDGQLLMQSCGFVVRQRDSDDPPEIYRFSWPVYFARERGAVSPDSGCLTVDGLVEGCRYRVVKSGVSRGTYQDHVGSFVGLAIDRTSPTGRLVIRFASDKGKLFSVIASAIISIRQIPDPIAGLKPNAIIIDDLETGDHCGDRGCGS